MESMGYVKYGILNRKVIQSYLKGPRNQKRREFQEFPTMSNITKK